MPYFCMYLNSQWIALEIEFYLFLSIWTMLFLLYIILVVLNSSYFVMILHFIIIVRTLILLNMASANLIIFCVRCDFSSWKWSQSIQWIEEVWFVFQSRTSESKCWNNKGWYLSECTYVSNFYKRFLLTYTLKSVKKCHISLCLFCLRLLHF